MRIQDAHGDAIRQGHDLYRDGCFPTLTHLFDIQTRVIYMIVHDNQNLLSEVAGRIHTTSKR